MFHGKTKKLAFMILVVFFFGSLFLLGCDDSDSDSGDNKESLNEPTATTWYKDSDGDGFGDPDVPITQSSQPLDYVANSDDCNDYDAEVYPGAPELCDGKDNDCDGDVDEGACDLKQIEISGEITNLADAADYISEDAYLQLVAMPASGNIDFETDGHGRIVYSSDLATAEIQSTDSFQFEILNLLPGTYVIAAQSLEPYDAVNDVSAILSVSADEFAEVNIPEEYTEPLQIELGEVLIPLSEKTTQTETSESQNANSPPEPPGISASDGAYTDKVRVTWDATEGATSYEVYRAASYMGTKEKITTTSETRYDDTAIPCGDSYYYWVKAKNSYGTSNFFYSDAGYRKCPVPSAPTNFSASDGDYENMIRLRWNVVSDAASYDIYRATSPEGAKTLIGSVETLSYDDTSADCADTYYYWVKASNSSGESEFSSYDEGELSCSGTSAGAGDSSASVGDLPVPTQLTASDGTFADKVRLKWKNSASASSYDVYRSKQLCDEKIKIGSTSANIFDDTSVPNRTIFYYWVKAKNSSLGESEYSEHDTGHLMRIPDPPRGVSASDGKYLDKIRVTWNAVGIAKSYEIYRADWSGAPKSKIGTTSNASFYDSSVECSTCCPEDYAYFVKARNDAGISAFSDYDTGYVYQTLRDPSSVSASDDKRCCVYVSWDPVAGAKSYRIYRADSVEGTKRLIGTSSADCCFVYQDATVTCPKVYYYWVKAVDAKGYTSCTYGEPDTGSCTACSDN